MLSKFQHYWRFLLTIVVGVAGLILEFGFAQTTTVFWIIVIYNSFIALLLLINMIKTLRGGNFGVDILAISAIVATLAVGQYWASLVIVLMLTGGEALEDFAAGRARRELKALLDRAPTLAHVWQERDLTDVDVHKVQPGDRILVRPGEVVPVDGKLDEDSASFDESSLTGESLPVEIKRGGTVMSGAVNSDNAVTITAIATAENSQFERIIALVREAESQPAPFVRMADRYALPFTIVAYLIAGAAWALSGEPLRFAEVLVLASPCPLILAAPIALISGMSRSSRQGIIMKNGVALEKLAKARTIVFDKTGTLTHGDVAVDEILPTKGFTANQVLKLAASAEQSSAHVLATSLATYAKRGHIKLLPAGEVEEMTGNGVVAQIGEQTVIVGKVSFLKKHRIKVPKGQTASSTHIAIAVDGKFAGFITFTDRIRPGAKRMVQQLRKDGVDNILMLTGDNHAAAAAIAEQVGIEHFHAGYLPEDKVNEVRGNAMPHPIVMVGDGVNDAPVLAAADVGIAMGARGSTAASETADIVIMKDDLSKVGTAFHIAKHTIRIARQSVIVGITICLALMLVATTGLIPVLLGAILQELIDVTVILNALRAHRQK